MKRTMLAKVLAASLAAPVAYGQTEKPHASAVKGAAVGAVAGHMMGHHTKTGAVAGAMVGHHMRKKEEQRNPG